MDYVHRTNLIPDPRFQHVDSMVAKDVTARAFDHENGHRYARASYDGVGTEPYLNIANDINTIPGSYRLFYNVFAQGGDGKLNVYTREANKPNNYVLAYSMPVSNGQTIRQASNQLTLNALTIVRIVPPKTEGGLIMITEVNLESASTYDDGLPYFDWATMPDPRGGGVFVLALSLLLSAALSGGWRHERAASDSQPVSGPQDENHSIEAYLYRVQAGVLEQRVRAGVGQVSGVDARSDQGRGQLGGSIYPASSQREARARMRVQWFGDVARAVDVALDCGRLEFPRVHGPRVDRYERGVHRAGGWDGQGHVPCGENHWRAYRGVQRVHRQPGRLPDIAGDRYELVPRLGPDARPAGLVLGVVA